jgi:hypothetical protein
MVSLEDYRKAVESLAQKKKNFDIQNEGDAYAIVIFSNIFKNAENRVRIAANTLRNAVVDSNEYQDALDVFLAKEDTTLQIIVSKLPDNVSERINTNIYRRLYNHPAYQEGRIHIKNANRSMFKINGAPANFCVADGLMYRIENDIEKRTALCNFGNKARALRLEEVFEQGFNSIEKEIDLGQVFA